MVLGVNHQKAQEVCQRHAPENGVTDMGPPGRRGRDEIGFEGTHGRFQASQKGLG